MIRALKLVFSGLALASPSVGHYKDRHYIFVFSFLFSATWIQSTYHLLTASTVRNWDCVVTVVSFALVWIAVTTPQPLHPKDMMSDGYEKFEVKDGNIYRDVSYHILLYDSQHSQLKFSLFFIGNRIFR